MYMICAISVIIHLCVNYSNDVSCEVDGSRGCQWPHVLHQVWRLVIRRSSVRDHHLRAYSLHGSVDM